MKKFTYSKAHAITFGKKWQVWLIDFLLFILLGVGLSFASVNINKSLPIYTETSNNVNSKIEELNAINKEAKLLGENSEGRNLSIEEMYEEWAKRSILLSYENNQEYFKANGYENIPQNDEMEGLSALDIDHDYLGYFYIKYLPNLDGEFNQPSYGDLSPEEYYHDVFVSINSEISSFSFLNNYPILNPGSAIELYRYVVLEERTDNNSGQQVNNEVAAVFTNTLNHSSQIMSSLTFFAEPYSEYLTSYQELINFLNIDYFLAYTVSFLILYVLIPLIFRDGRTLARLMLKVVVADNEDKKLSFLRLVSRWILEFILNYFVVFIFAILVTGTNAIVLPIFYLGSFGVSMFAFITISFVFFIADILTSLIRSDKRDLIELITRSTSLDGKVLESFGDEYLSNKNEEEVSVIDSLTK